MSVSVVAMTDRSSFPSPRFKEPREVQLGDGAAPIGEASHLYGLFAPSRCLSKKMVTHTRNLVWFQNDIPSTRLTLFGWCDPSTLFIDGWRRLISAMWGDAGKKRDDCNWNRNGV